MVFFCVNSQAPNQSSFIAFFCKVVFTPEELVSVGDDVVPDHSRAWVIVAKQRSRTCDELVKLHLVQQKSQPCELSASLSGGHVLVLHTSLYTDVLVLLARPKQRSAKHEDDPAVLSFAVTRITFVARVIIAGRRSLELGTVSNPFVTVTLYVFDHVAQSSLCFETWSGHHSAEHASAER